MVVAASIFCPYPLLAQEAPPATVVAPPADVAQPTPPIVPAPLTPPQLIDKSIRDVEHGRIGEAAKDDVAALRRGPLLIHGNYCGVGNRPGTPPLDALDEACMHHDACTKTGNLPPCTCNKQFIEATKAVADDPTETPNLRALAATTMVGIAVLVCK